MKNAPSLFISHGSPMMGLEDSSARRFLAALGAELGKPKAILVASAHWETERLLVSAAERPATIHDFYGFPPALYESRYEAPGAPDAARRAAELIEGAGMTAALDAARGLDHGAWVPLQLMYPEADVPVAQISIETHLGPRRQLDVGRALAPLRDEGVMIVGSGNLTHDLSALQRGAVDAAPPDWVADFADWVFDAVATDRLDDLVDYRRLAPHGQRNHPAEDHFLPLFTALGAGGPGGRGRRLHASYTYAVLAMDAYAFEYLVKRLLEEMGYQNVEVTQRGGDGGVDVIGEIELGITSVREVVQAKRHRKTIQRKDLDALRGSLYRFDAVRGTIVTTSKFTSGVQKAAFERGAAPITLIDGDKLVDLLIQYGIGVRKRTLEVLAIDADAFADLGEDD